MTFYMHVPGPDDLIDYPTREAAQQACDEHNAFLEKERARPDSWINRPLAPVIGPCVVMTAAEAGLPEGI